jgi:carbamoyltransferase
MIVLGISAFYHDSAAALVKDGKIIAAAQEERFTRKKHDAGFPGNAVAYCLDEAAMTFDDVDFVAFYEKPLLTFNRLVETYLSYVPRGFPSFVKSIPIWVKEKVFQKSLLLKGLTALDRGAIPADKLLFGFHHHSHAASAFYPSPFDEAAILVMDGVGEWATATFGVGHGNKIELRREIRFPHSLGMLYSAFTYYLGFKVNEGEYKVMGLAPYGEPKYVQEILDNLIDVKDDGSFHMNMDFFNYCTGLTMTNSRFDELFGGPPRQPEAPLTKREMDIARSVQVVTEEVVLRLCRSLHEETGLRNLCMAGGVALNCVANGRILREGPFDEIWIQPAAGDAGGALGVALAIDHEIGGVERVANGADTMQGAYLGPAFDASRISADLAKYGAVTHEYDDDTLFETIVGALTDEKVVGWFQGRMEFGPRALGNRSILGDARSPAMQRMINLKIKYREGFRPFAPAVAAECIGEYFDIDRSSPYMLLVAQVREDRCHKPTDAQQVPMGLDRLNEVRSDIPAVTHVDYSARIQSVHRETNPRFHRLLETFRARTGYGVLVNTSFNIRDEPIVCTPEEAYRCFMGSEMDVLVLGNTVLFKGEQW